MLHPAKGNLFNYKTTSRVNTVNCVGVMGAGIALAFKTRYPEMFIDYQKTCRAKQLQPGLLHVWVTGEGEHIINFPTKTHWKAPSEYSYIEAGLIALRTYILENNIQSLTLPALGCGHGGLDWARVYSMIEQNLHDLPTDIYVFPPSVSHAMGRAAKRVSAESNLTLDL